MATIIHGSFWDDNINPDPGNYRTPDPAYHIYGYGGNDRLYGGDNDDVLDGGTGADFMSGDTGDDSYYVDNAGDVISEGDQHAPFGAGYDTVYAAISYTLPNATLPKYFGSAIVNGVEKLVLLESGGATNGFGNEIGNDIRGNSHDNRLEGRDGDDTLYGYAGEDRLYGGKHNDSLYGGLHDDVLDGGEGNDHLYGEGGYDILMGGLGNDVLDGGEEMYGGSGDDEYYVYTANTVVSEFLGGGYDQVFSTVDYSLPAGFEALMLVDGHYGLDGTGNGLDNTLVGNNSINTLQGLDGDDIIAAGAHNDRLLGGAGSDTLYGEQGFDILDGGTGNDTMIGGTGYDTYYVDSAADVVEEYAGEGRDTVNATVSHTLASNVEILNLVAGQNGTGNNLANIITGNAGDNNLNGGDGNDTLIGGSDTSIDRLTGGAGFDTFLYRDRDDSRAFATRTGDAIQDFDVNEDLIDLRALDIDAADLLIQDRVIQGVNLSTVSEDANGNGFLDEGEFSILVRIEGSGFVTTQDLLL